MRSTFLLLMITAAAAVEVVPTDPSVVTGAIIDESLVSVIIHVDASAAADGTGSAENPLGSVERAIRRAEIELNAGRSVKVAIAAGIYREGSIAIRGYDLDPAARDAVLVIEGGPGVILSGAEDWSNKPWEPVLDAAGAIAYYRIAWPYAFGLKSPGWGQYDPKGLAAYRREMVILDGKILDDVYIERYTKPDKGPMLYVGFVDPATKLWPGTFAVAEREENGHSLFLKLPNGVAIADAQIEVAVHPFILTFSGMRNVVLRGLDLRHTASSNKHQGLMIGSQAWMELGGNDDAMRWTNEQVLVEDCRFDHHNAHGLAISGCDGVTLRRVSASHNGIGGIRNWTIRNLLIEDLDTSFNNWRGHRGGLVGWGIAGMKSHGVFDAVIRRHTAIGNLTEGQWWDIDNRNITIEGLVAIGNRNRGLFLEISPGPFHISNSVIGDSTHAAAFRLDCAQDVTVTDTTFFAGAHGQDVINLTAKLAPKTRSTPQSTLAIVTGKRQGEMMVNSGPLRMSGCTVVASASSSTLVFMNSAAPELYASMMGGQRYSGAGNQYYHASAEAAFGIGFMKGKMTDYAGWTAFAAEIDSRWEDPAFRDPGSYDLRAGEPATGYHMPAEQLATLRAFRAAIATQPSDEPVALQGDGGDASFTE